ncbi:MAG: IS3 family transposase [Desulfobacula sp.]|nr:IS3 family transposase [Desulfobacula sp.]
MIFLLDLKTQLIHHVRFKAFDETEKRLFRYIEMYYNLRRKHSANSWIAPAHF